MRQSFRVARYPAAMASTPVKVRDGRKSLVEAITVLEIIARGL
jgi:hypothetical protein